MTNFRVGQKVVCINDEWKGGGNPLRKGAIYTVSGMGPEVLGLSFDGVSKHRTVILAEVKNPDSKSGKTGFNPARFRPVVARKTDISIFTDMLNTQRTGVPA